MFSPKRCCCWLLALALLIPAVGYSSSPYYSIWKVLGKEKRDLLRREVKGLGKDQKKAVKPLRALVDVLQSVDSSDLASLERSYNKATTNLSRVERRFKAIQNHIDGARKVAGDLFAEWEQEIDQFSEPQAQMRSREKLLDTMNRFEQLDEKMRLVEKRIPLVMNVLRDRVLELKHGLNAREVSFLPANLEKLETDVEDLIAAMTSTQAAIDTMMSFLK